MNLLALLVACAAILCFLVDTRPPASPRAWALVPIGLALFVAAFIIQLVWQGGTIVTAH